ncbi:MAG: hypothetical protein M1269_00490 [Chloroflexi bacterium]|nr:hypothetical protein [Chloroflexota bacterium]
MKRIYVIIVVLFLVLLGVGGYYFIKMPRVSGKEKYLLDMLKRDADDHGARLELADYYFNSGRYKDASGLLAKDSGDMGDPVWNVRALILHAKAISRELKFHTGQAPRFKPSEESISYLEQADRMMSSIKGLSPDEMAGLHVLLAEEMKEQDLKSGAARHFSEAVRLSKPGETQLKARMMLLRNLILAKNKKEAEIQEAAFLKDVEKLPPIKKQEWFYLLGESYYIAGDYYNARVYLKETAEIPIVSSGSLEAHILLGRMDIKEGDRKGSIEELRKVRREMESALKDSPMDVQSRDFVFGMVLESARDFIFVPRDDKINNPRADRYIKEFNEALKNRQYEKALGIIDGLISEAEKQRN